MTLIQRDGRAKSFHVANVTAKTVRPIIVTNASRASSLMTDESLIYPKIGEDFAIITRSITAPKSALAGTPM